MLVVIRDERENDREPPLREDWPPAASQSADVRSGSPGSCHGDMAGPPSVTGASSAHGRCEFGWYRGRFAFRPNRWDGGLFCYRKDRRYEIEDRSFGIRQGRIMQKDRMRPAAAPISYLLTPNSEKGSLKV